MAARHIPSQKNIKVLNEMKVDGVRHVHLAIDDRFSTRRHKLERTVFRKLVDGMEAYLRRHPEIHFDHPRNHVRRIIYFPKALRSWSAYMPGSFATHSAYNPDHKKLINGTKIDYITRNLFRHSADAIGLRTRAHAIEWFVREHTAFKSPLRWVSMGSGTGQVTLDVVQQLDDGAQLWMTDVSQEVLDIAKSLAGDYGISKSHVHTKVLDVNDTTALESLIREANPDVIEAMGLVEYLDDAQLSAFLTSSRQTASKNSVIIFTNMMPSHPHLQVHKRGLGWPDVIQRETKQMVQILRRVGFSDMQLTVMTLDDGVYAVYAIRL